MYIYFAYRIYKLVGGRYIVWLKHMFNITVIYIYFDFGFSATLVRFPGGLFLNM